MSPASFRTTLSSFRKFLEMAANTANTERFMLLSDDDVDKFLEAEENKKDQEGRSLGDIKFWIATAGKAARNFSLSQTESAMLTFF